MRIIEIGPGSNPIFMYSGRVEENLKSGGTYLGVDVLVNCQGDLKRFERTYAVQGDLAKLPLSDNMADEIWLCNVIGGGINSRPEKLPNGNMQYTIGVGRYFEEMRRVLTPSGKIYVAEWIPRVGDLDWMKRADYQPDGFTKEVYSGRRLKKFIDNHQISLGMTWEDTPPFFLEFTRTR